MIYLHIWNQHKLVVILITSMTYFTEKIFPTYEVYFTKDKKKYKMAENKVDTPI
jgi:hypothetical protein